MTIEWDDARMLFIPPLHSYKCPAINATSPAPTAVQNVRVESFQVLGHAEISVNISWDLPLNVNGVLKAYNVCLSLMPLGNEPQQVTLCDNGATVAVSLNWYRPYRVSRGRGSNFGLGRRNLTSPTLIFKIATIMGAS